MFRKMPFLLIGIIALVMCFGEFIPKDIQSFLYGMSISIKSFIVCVLPVVVFGLLFKTAVHFSKYASGLILFIFFMVCVSNFLSTMVSFSAGHVAFCLDLSIQLPNEEHTLMPYDLFLFPKWVGTDRAILTGLVLGLVSSWTKPQIAQRLSLYLERVIAIILKIILYTIPLFLTGFVIKMHHDKLISHLLQNYSRIFLLVTSWLIGYLTLLYFVVAKFQLKKAWEYMKNMAPAALAGFGSMSSAAAMPLTILGAEKNGKDPDFANAVIPATVNIHLIGDCFAIPIFALAIMHSFGMQEPTIYSYLLFTVYFVMAKFSVAAVPGGGILVMLPILEKYLGFSSEMLSLITALYILFDPLITCANIFGNGAFSLYAEKIFSVFVAKKEKS